MSFLAARAAAARLQRHRSRSTLEWWPACYFSASGLEERHADLPWARKHLGIFDGGFVQDDVRAARGVTLDDVKSIAVEVAGAIEPRLVIENGHIHNQRVALPVPH